MSIVERPDGGRLAIHNKVAYFAGHVSKEPYPTIEEQTQALCDRYDELFAQFGLKKENIIMFNAYFRDISMAKPFLGGSARTICLPASPFKRSVSPKPNWSSWP